MAIAALVAAVVGLFGLLPLLLGGHSRRRHLATPAIGAVDVVNIARDDHAVPCKLHGQAMAGTGTLTAPFSRTPCLYYSARTVRRYRTSTDGQTSVHEETVSADSSTAPFRLRDVSGGAWIYPQNAHPVGLLRTVWHQQGDMRHEECVVQQGARLFISGGAQRDHAGNAWIQAPYRGTYMISGMSEEKIVRRARLTQNIGRGIVAAGLGAALVLGIGAFFV